MPTHGDMGVWLGALLARDTILEMRLDSLGHELYAQKLIDTFNVLMSNMLFERLERRVYSLEKLLPPNPYVNGNIGQNMTDYDLQAMGRDDDRYPLSDPRHYKAVPFKATPKRSDSAVLRRITDVSGTLSTGRIYRCDSLKQVWEDSLLLQAQHPHPQKKQ